MTTAMNTNRRRGVGGVPADGESGRASTSPDRSLAEGSGPPSSQRSQERVGRPWDVTRSGNEEITGRSHQPTRRWMNKKRGAEAERLHTVLTLMGFQLILLLFFQGWGPHINKTPSPIEFGGSLS